MGATQLFPQEAEPQRAAGKYGTAVCKYQSQSHLSSLERKEEQKACGVGRDGLWDISMDTLMAARVLGNVTPS